MANNLGPILADLGAAFAVAFTPAVLGGAVALIGIPGAVIGATREKIAPVLRFANQWLNPLNAGAGIGSMLTTPASLPALPPGTTAAGGGGVTTVNQYNSFGDFTIEKTADVQEVLEELAGLEGRAPATAGTAGLPGAD